MDNEFVELMNMICGFDVALKLNLKSPRIIRWYMGEFMRSVEIS